MMLCLSFLKKTVAHLAHSCITAKLLICRAYALSFQMYLPVICRLAEPLWFGFFLHIHNL